MNPTPYLKGMATFIPGFYPHLVNLVRPGRTGGTVSARYCYSVWLRHLVLAHESGLPTAPEVVAELGPGDSLGIGAAALLSGADEYYAFDVVEYASAETNLQVLRELVDLFAARAPIPDETEFPGVRPRLADYGFPHHVLSDARLARTLDAERVEQIAGALASPGPEPHGRIRVSYCVPWDDPQVIRARSVDLVYSQAVMEHVDDIEGTYRALRTWLKDTGFMSHTIDFRCHGTAAAWNGHWGYSNLEWKLVRGRRPYLLNREPHSTHLAHLEGAGFRVVEDLREDAPGGLPRARLARRWRGLTDDDLQTATAFLQAVPAD